MSLAHCRRMGWYGRAVNSGDAPPPVFHGFVFFPILCVRSFPRARDGQKRGSFRGKKERRDEGQGYYVHTTTISSPAVPPPYPLILPLPIGRTLLASFLSSCSSFMKHVEEENLGNVRMGREISWPSQIVSSKMTSTVLCSRANGTFALR